MVFDCVADHPSQADDHHEEGEDAGCGGAAPAELLQQRHEEDGEGVVDAVGQSHDDEDGGHDHPAIEEGEPAAPAGLGGSQGLSGRR